EREIPNKPLTNVARAEPSSIPPPLLRPSPQAERPPEPKRIVVQTRDCVDYDDPGEVLEGYFDIRGSVLYVWNSSDASPIGTMVLAPGDDPGAAARKLLREKSGKGRFNQPINYPKRHYH